jgi:serine/threonine protein kinase
MNELTRDGDNPEFENDGFVAVALQHGLLNENHAEKILDHAVKTKVRPSDAALTLSMLELYEVDAIHLLCQPESLAKGYVLTGLIGCGAGGMVFRAHQTALGRDVALKTINVRSRNASTTAQSRMQREAHAIARLQHPHIVTAYDSGFHQGRFCIAMELVEGETLADLIKRSSPIDEEITWQITRQVASALSHANGFGIIHRDIKPANLLLGTTPSGMVMAEGVPMVKVADFGLAFESDESGASQITATGATLGTPAYVAPEQLHDTHVDARADIYSLGATVFHMLTGLPPCLDRSPMRTIMQKTIGDDRWREEMLDSVSKPSVALFRNMTEINVDERIGNYDELIQRIDDLLVDLAGKTATEQRNASSDRIQSLSFSKRSIMILALSFVSIVGAGSLLLRNPSTEPTKTAEWKVDGFPQPLFNGQSVPLFRQSGNWTTGSAADGGRVLSGKEGSRMTIPVAIKNNLAAHARLRIAVHADKSGIVEIGLSQDAKPIESLGTLVFKSWSAEFIPSSETIDTAPEQSSKIQFDESNDFLLQQVTIKRLPDHVIVIVNGQTLATVESENDAGVSIELRCMKQDASFADVDVVGLSPVTNVSL